MTNQLSQPVLRREDRIHFQNWSPVRFVVESASSHSRCDRRAAVGTLIDHLLSDSRAANWNSVTRFRISRGTQLANFVEFRWPPMHRAIHLKTFSSFTRAHLDSNCSTAIWMAILVGSVEFSRRRAERARLRRSRRSARERIALRHQKLLRSSLNASNHLARTGTANYSNFSIIYKHTPQFTFLSLNREFARSLYCRRFFNKKYSIFF